MQMLLLGLIPIASAPVPDSMCGLSAAEIALE
ncbi:hypothetical protein A8926_3385 [Saccharopolyspora spinosa]|uniref:Uncharacterized protein n=1 Tax=Saccharopolyspora spinosa TaxID=60894 RepID=A0A2N3XYE3_SACSN|nr:hypothetical protein A8926_3385 [Saccharopolyspora spinosa]